ncbi:MAG: ATP synthase subunit I [Spirochaetota bacterium]
MNDVVSYFGAFLAGGGVGALFFWGLWVSLRIAERRGSKAPILIGSFLLRSAIVVGVMVLILRLSDAYGLIAFMLGFLLSRFVMTYTLGRHHG